MKKKTKGQKGYTFGEDRDQMVKNMHAKKQTFWSKATGGRMK